MQLRTHNNEQPGVVGELSVAYDIATGHVRARGAGFYSTRQTNAFFRDWSMIVEAIHGEGLAVSALVDMSDGQVQSHEVSDIIASVTNGMYQPGDAIAMLVPNSLAKIQMRRVLDGRYHEFFLSPNAAETWLEGRTIGLMRAAG